MGVTEIVLTILLGAIGSLIAAQLYDCSPRLAHWLLRRAVARLPEDLRERLAEEWEAHLARCSGKLSMIWAAIGFSLASGGFSPSTPVASASPGLTDGIWSFYLRGVTMILRYTGKSVLDVSETILNGLYDRISYHSRLLMVFIASFAGVAALFKLPLNPWFPIISVFGLMIAVPIIYRIYRDR